MMCRKNLLSALAQKAKIGVEKTCYLLQLKRIKEKLKLNPVCGVEKTCYMLQSETM